MNILFDIGHPAHVHLFKVAREKLMAQGHQVFFMARDKEITLELLEKLEIPYILGTKQKKGLKAALELWPLFWKIFKFIKAHKIDVIASIGSESGSWAAKVRGIPHIAFNDTETAPEQRMLYLPASTKVYTPACLYGDWGPKQIRYAGTHDLAYLRPEHFTPDDSVLDELGLEKGEKFAIMRLVSWSATHDVVSGDKSQESLLVDVFQELSKKYKVFVSGEANLPAELEPNRLSLPPHRMHHAVAFASALVGDSATMTTEAAVLGRPALYVTISRYINELGCIKFLSKDYKLLDTLDWKEFSIAKITQFLDDPRWGERETERARLLNETIDVAGFIAEQCLLHGNTK